MAYVHGRYCAPEEAKISIFDLGFTRSDAVYDVTSTWKGKFFRLDEHISRFLRSCAGINLTCPYGAMELKCILATCVQAGGVAHASYVSMTLTRGQYTDDEARRNRDIFRTRPSFIAYAIPYVSIADAATQERGLHMIISKTPRIASASVDMRYKNYHWGDLTQGKFEARAAGADCALHCAAQGFLTEGAGFNFFFVKNDTLCTPARNVLEGVTRQTALDLAQEMRIPFELGDYLPSELIDADDAFITSTAGGVMPIVRIDDRILRGGLPGPVAMQLREAYWRKRSEGWLGTEVATLADTRRAENVSAILHSERPSSIG